MSDQHGQAYTQMEHPDIDTPNLMELAGEGLSFDRCYCSAPLCVPSRMSFLSGKLPAGLGIFDNDSTLPSDMPTIAHALGERGYRTVLIGRMHFKGDDQRHGFDERLVGDITSQFWGTGGAQRTDFGAFIRTTNRKHCLDAVGGGCSPVMAYDEAVFEAAMEYLSRKHDEPLFLIVGFYGPHFPFACDPELYRKYQARFPVEEASGGRCEDVYDDYRQDCSPEKRRDCKAAYCGLVETIDGYVGQLRRLFSKNRKDYVFLYTSDHGEQLGKRSLFGKQTLYEDAVRVPLMIEGTGIPHGRCRSQVSLLDVSRTILAMAGADAAASWHLGTPIDLAAPEAKRPPVVIQQLLEHEGELMTGEAVISMPYKAVRYGGGAVRVYDLLQDPDETKDISSQYPGVLRDLEPYLMSRDQITKCIEHELTLTQQHEILKAWGKKKRPREWATVTNPPRARQKPVE